MVQLNDSEAWLVVGLADALADGRLNPEAPTVTARQAAAALGQASRASVNDMADLLSRLGVFHRMKGPNPYQRPVVELVSAIAAHEEQAREQVNRTPTLNLPQLPLVQITIGNKGGE